MSHATLMFGLCLDFDGTSFRRSSRALAFTLTLVSDKFTKKALAVAAGTPDR